MIEIAPSVIAADLADLVSAARMAEAGAADLLHVDVMDGHFVPNLTIGPPVVAALRRVARVPLDVHLMISEPDRYLEAFVDAGAAMISGHLDIPDGTVVGAATVILSTIEKPGVYTGAFPVTEHATWKGIAVELRRLGDLARRLRALERSAASGRADSNDAAGRRRDEA